MSGRRPVVVRSPSGSAGVALVWRLRRLVGVLWIVDQLIALPAVVVAVSALDGRLGDAIDPWKGDGEALVVALELLGPMVWPLGLAVMGTLFGWWVWNVVWRAGVVTWAVWGSPGAVRGAEVVGHGLLRWWRFARLHLATTVLVFVAMSALAWALVAWATSATRAGRAGTLPLVWAVAVVVAVVVVGALGAATAAGCWRLGTPDVRSALRSLWHGLTVVARHPLRSLGLVATWWVVAFGVAVAPVGVALAGGSSVLVAIVLEVGLVVRATCRVGLLGTFVPSLGIAADNLSDG